MINSYPSAGEQQTVSAKVSGNEIKQREWALVFFLIVGFGYKECKTINVKFKVLVIKKKIKVLVINCSYVQNYCIQLIMCYYI